MADQKARLDTQIEVSTPENVSFRYHVAGPFQRLPAYLIDWMACVTLFAILGFAALFVGLFLNAEGILLGIWQIVVFLVLFFYGPVMETYWNGQTIGKKFVGIRVISAAGQPIDGSQAVLRNLLRVVDILPAGYLVGLIAAATNRRFQRVGDMLADTIVVVEQPHAMSPVIRVNEPGVAQVAARLPRKLTVSRHLAKALSGYVHERLHLTPNRRLEIAKPLADVCRARWNLPPQIGPDLVLCALYHRVFLEEESPGSR